MAGNDIYTKLLLHSNGTDGSPLFPDASRSRHVVTAVGNAQVDTSQYKFPTGSGLFDGAGDYLSVPDSPDWDFGSNALCYDFWVRLNDRTGLQCPLNFYMDDDNLFRINLMGDNTIKFYIVVATATALELTSTTEILDATWYHLAVIRGWGSGANNWALCIDGTAEDTATYAGALSSNSKILYIGSETPGNTAYNGWLDEIRISNGIARWTSNFTSPTEPYFNSGGLAFQPIIF